MGPLSLPLLPPLAPLACDREAEAPPVAGTAAPPSSAAATPVQQLAAALEQADPGLVARLAATGERADAAFFQRWLHARGSVEAAAAAIQAHAAWRTAFVGVDDGGAAGALGAGAAATPAAGALPPLGRGISEASIADELAARKVFLQGLDAGGCPVVVVQASRCGGVGHAWGVRAAPPNCQPLGLPSFSFSRHAGSPCKPGTHCPSLPTSLVTHAICGLPASPCRHDMGRRNLAHTKRLIAYVLDRCGGGESTFYVGNCSAAGPAGFLASNGGAKSLRHTRY